MKKNTNSAGMIRLFPRTFTFSQLSKISDDNNGILLEGIDISSFRNDDIFELKPLIVFIYPFGIKVNPHLRTSVSKLNEDDWLALQDLSYEQWDQGKEIQKIAS